MPTVRWDEWPEAETSAPPGEHEPIGPGARRRDEDRDPTAGASPLSPRIGAGGPPSTVRRPGSPVRVGERLERDGAERVEVVGLAAGDQRARAAVVDLDLRID